MVHDQGPDRSRERTLHGSAILHESSTLDISPVFSASGSTAAPLGHNLHNRNLGLAFDLGPNGLKGHALTFGKTRGGKGVSSIVPAALTLACNLAILDPKGENYWITAPRRRQLGQKTILLDHWGEVQKNFGNKAGVSEPSSKFNPLSPLRADDPDFADEVSAIAEALILQTGNDPHWPDTAKELVAGLIAAEVIRNPGKASIRNVRKLITAPIQKLKKEIETVIKTYPDSVAASKLAAFVETDEKGQMTSTREVSAIRSTARTQTAFLDSPQLLDGMETDDNDFTLDELATGKVSLYLVLPVDRLRTHGRWLRMILTLAIRAIARQAERPKLPVTFILDELGTISPGSGLTIIEQSYGLMAGLGIRIWGFLQDLPQLKRDYPDSWETFISNSSVIQLLDVNDNTTRDYFSAYLGNTTVEVHKGFSKHLRPTKKTGSFSDRFTKSFQQSQEVFSQVGGGIAVSRAGYEQETWEADKEFHPRPVLFPWEVKDSPKTDAILCLPDVGNFRLQRFVYYSDPIMSTWARHDPNREKSAIVYDQPPAPANDNKSNGVVDLGDLGKKASKVVGGLIDRFNKRA